MRAALVDLAPGLQETCGDYLRHYRDGFADALRNGGSAVAGARAFARSIDGVLSALFCASEVQASGDARVCLVAVGGYGRGMVGLRSDVDLLFLTDDPASPRVEAIATGMLYPLWDLELDIGHAVRGTAETLALAREDVRTATTLLDLRAVAGNRTLVQELKGAARRHVFEPRLGAFIDALEDDTTRRHRRAGDSLHLLEPDVKLSPGGLRDLDIARWAAGARWRATRLGDLLERGVLQRRDVDELQAAQEFLWSVRGHLHLRNRRRQDRLTFADQEDIAEALGFVDRSTLGVEQFMQAYYRHAGVIARAAERMLSRARHEGRRSRTGLRRLGNGLAHFDGAVTLERTDDVRVQPMLALRLYDEVLRAKLPPYGFAREAVVRAASEPAWCERLRAEPEAGPLFARLMTATERSGVAKGSLPAELHRVGLTTAIVPELEPLVGRVVHDLFHVYTFDVHAIAALDRLRALARGKRFEHMGLASRLALESPRPLPLHLAALLHVLSKRKAWAKRVAKADFTERFGLSHADGAHLRWLLGEQRTLYESATRRDTSDPDVIAELAERIGSRNRLRDLYLLTASILSTTNPRAMSSWNERLLDDLYFALETVIEGEADPDRIRALRQQVAVGFVGDAGEGRLQRFVESLPDRYVLANDADAIRRHARLARDSVETEGGVALGLGPGPSDGVSELVLWTHDRPGLLADVCAALTSRQVGIVRAQVYTAGEMALDVFWVRRAPGGRARDGEISRLDQRLRARLETDLHELAAGTLTADAAIARLGPAPAWAVRHTPGVETLVHIDSQVARQHTLVEVYTEDRVGVLHAITACFRDQALTIDLAKINTEGARAADVFYVRERTGEKLSAERINEVKSALLAKLTEL
ncbi:MAG: [protein-PII] uridylyltransferase [Myxococcota bacterium]